MSKKRYSQSFKDQAVQKVLQGSTPREVAEQTKASSYSIRDWVKAHKTSQRERPATATELAEI